MEPSASSNSDTEQHLHEVLAVYLESLESDRPTSRDELLASYPNLAGRLERFLAEQEEVSCLTAPLRSMLGDARELRVPEPDRAEASEFAAGRMLGDYRLEREIGRGGMGVVYEALQLSLGRRVALKVLPFAAALDERQLQRFKHEAQSAAHLHHPSIVPIFGVGSDRGAHYYAMQYIEGHTLARLIAEIDKSKRTLGTRSPSRDEPSPQGSTDASTALEQLGLTAGSWRPADFHRLAARWGIQVAEALDYAHALGVIHRDIKPSNLLVDLRGQIWITDFGLAQTQGDHRLTHTGDVVGTLRYMSPEQALAKRSVVDHRTDVYSLGVTLYELLTQSPAVQGTDRQELLEMHARRDPVAPRAVNPGLPVDLETIILKAIAKAPAERYGSAKELADDLRAFVETRPIAARRPGPFARGRKWLLRHQSAALVFMATLLVAVVALAGSTFFAIREANEAERLRQKANQTVNTLWVYAVENVLAQEPHLEPAKRELLENTLKHYAEQVQNRSDDPVVKRELGNAHRRMGVAHRMLGNLDQAVEAGGHAVSLFEALLAIDPHHFEVRVDLATCHNNLGMTLFAKQQYQQADSHLQRAQEVAEQLVAEAPTDPRCQVELARAHLQQAAVRIRGGSLSPDTEHHCAAAVKLLRKLTSENARVPEYRRELAQGLNYQARWFQQNRKLPEAMGHMREALGIIEGLVAEFPRVADFRDALGGICQNMSMGLAQPDQFDEATGMLRRSLVERERLATEWPKVPGYREEIAKVHHLLARKLFAVGKKAEALKHCEEAVRVRRQMVETYPNVPEYLRALASACYTWGSFLMADALRSQASAQYEEGLGLLRQVVARAPNVPAYQDQLAWCLATCPDQDLRDAAGAVHWARKATAAAPDKASYWTTLAAACCLQGELEASRNALSKSMSLANGGDPVDWCLLAHVLARLGGQGDLGDPGEREEAKRLYDRALARLRPRAMHDMESRALLNEAAAALGLPDPLAAPAKPPATAKP